MQQVLLDEGTNHVTPMSGQELQIVDAQVHIWGANTPERPWPPAQLQPHRPVPFSREDLLAEMNAAGVDAAVLVPPMWEGNRNDLVLEAARLYPNRFAAMGRFDPEMPGARDLVATWRRQPGMLGMRFTFHRPSQRPLIAEGLLDWLWPLAEAAQVPVTMLVRHADMPLIDRIAERHPALKISLDHLGLTAGKDAEAFAGLDHVLALARRPNVAVKLSAIPHYTATPYPYTAVHPYVKRVYDAFGPRRMFWGTDFTHLPCTYRQAMTLFTDEMPWLTNEDKRWIMGRALCEWLGWERKGAATS